MARALTPEECKEIGAMSQFKMTPGTSARFTADGGQFDPFSGQVSRGNVIYSLVVWDISREQAKRIAELTGSHLVYSTLAEEIAASKRD